jgi:hypothetical protein
MLDDGGGEFLLFLKKGKNGPGRRTGHRSRWSTSSCGATTTRG